VTGFKASGIAVSNNSTLAQVASGALSARHGILFRNGQNVASGAATLFAAAGGTIAQVDPELIDPFNLEAPNFRPRPGSPALTLGAEIQPNDGFFEIALFRGALSDDPDADWTLGWTNYEQR
jgi:hypothetical protein